MKVRGAWLGCAMAFLGVCRMAAQTPSLSEIEAPYPAVQSAVKIGTVSYAKGAVAYGPAGTPLVLSGKNFGESVGTVLFPGAAAGSTVAAKVTDWSPTILFLTVPSGAVTGLVTVTSGGATSNSRPFIVTNGAYAGSMCPAFPPKGQLSISTSSLPDGIVGQPYSATLGADGGSPPYAWTLTGTLPAGLSLSASTGTIAGTPTSVAGPLSLAVAATDGSGESASAALGLTVYSEPMASATVYTYNAGFDGTGNIQTLDDQIIGSWSFGYDTLNRLVSGTSTAGSYSGQYGCWAYDSFGNRTAAAMSTVACANNPPLSSWANYNANNRFASTSQVPGGVPYDAGGNVLGDGLNTYLYDGEGRVCAAKSEPSPGLYTMTGYLYDAEGRRVAKGTLSSMSCNPATNGFATTESYVLGQGGEELSMLGQNGVWQRTNVYGAGKQLATYNGAGLHFQLTDPLGTRRVQVAANGVAELSGQSLPFGDALACSGSAADATPLHFTGKERDQESGLDYFGARYYASSMGRFMSPDWATKPYPVPYSKLDNPQTLNLYAYVGNNPMNRFDPDGHYSCDTKNHGAECGKIKDALAIVQKADSNLKEGSKERGRLDAVLKFYGSENDGKGPSVQFADLSKDGAVGETQTVNGKTTITFDTKALGNFGEAGKGEEVAHEGTHGMDDHTNRGPVANPFWNFFDLEYRAYQSESYVDRGLGVRTESDGDRPVWAPGMSYGQHVQNMTRNAYSNAQADCGDQCHP
jgi:RHS repeat-associated protein